MTKASSDGYVRIFYYDADRKRHCKMEHRIVWERTNGPLPPGMVVHHINGNKADNRIENLMVMKAPDHVRLHSKGHVTSEAQRQILSREASRANLGRPVSAETRAKISASLTGHIKSEATRERLRIAGRNRPVSEETRRKISETKKRKREAVALGFRAT